jgi:hypothetical protein
MGVGMMIMAEISSVLETLNYEGWMGLCFVLSG